MKIYAIFCASLLMSACTYGTDSGRPLTDEQAADAAPRQVVHGSRIHRSFPGYNVTLERSVVQGRDFAIAQVHPTKLFGSTDNFRARQADQMIREAYGCAVNFENVSPGTPLRFIDKTVIPIICR